MIAPLVNADGKTLYEYQNYRFALFPRRGGHALEQDNLDQLAWMGRFIGRLHAVAACRPFQHRDMLNVQTHGYLPYQFLVKHDYIPTYLKKLSIVKRLMHFLKTIDQLFAKISLI